MKITFLGASRNVTGSKFLLETNNSKVLIDCGLFQERAYLDRNWSKVPIKAEKVDCVLLTHAHIDHSGYLPKFFKEGYQGPIYCTAATADITKISLVDSAKLQEYDAEYKLRRHKREKRKGPFPVKPLYTVSDVQNIFSAFRDVEYEKPVQISSDISATYYDAGHIFGSAMIELKITENDRIVSFIFSGDIGRPAQPILRDPHIFSKADYLVMESTYGNRYHEDTVSSIDKLARIINETHERRGNVIIPAFAIGRTQEILYDLHMLLREKRIPEVKTYVDSPMADEVTKIFRKYTEYYDKEARTLYNRREELFDESLLKFTSTTKASKALNTLKGTNIIMAGSGMCTGGRIKHHLVNNIARSESTILFVGYQAEGTLGRKILERPKEVRILGQNYSVRSRIEKINGFSAHADQRELLQWFDGFKTKPEKVFVVHGELEASEVLAGKIRSRGPKVEIPEYEQVFEL